MMAGHPQPPLFTDALDLRAMLSEDNWFTPDTYCSKEFSCIINEPAIYLFMLYERDSFERALIAYVGMSTKLGVRLSGHETLNELRLTKCYVMRWFKRMMPPQLREKEKYYIEQFDPPWNIIGRRRGVVLS